MIELLLAGVATYAFNLIYTHTNFSEINNITIKTVNEFKEAKERIEDKEDLKKELDFILTDAQNSFASYRTSVSGPVKYFANICDYQIQNHYNSTLKNIIEVEA